MKIEELREKLQEVEDPRRTSKGNIRHKLEDIIIIGMCSLICNGNDVSDMEDFGKRGRRGCSNFWNCRKGFQTAIPFGGCLNGRILRRWQNACMTGWGSIARRAV